METREWYEQWCKQRREQELSQIERELKQAEELAVRLRQLQMMACFYKVRLGRPLTEAEHATLAEQFDRIGEGRVGEIVLSFSPEPLEAWLTDPEAR